MSETEKYLEWKQFVRDEELAADLANIEGHESEIFDRFFKSEHCVFGIFARKASVSKNF